MSASSAIGGGTGTSNDGVTLGNVVHRLQAIEEIVRPMQLVPEAVVTLETTVRDQGQQQVTLNLALQRVKQQV
jgi:hypothetical protein